MNSIRSLRKIDLARRVRHVDADLEAARIGLADLQLALAGLDVLGEHRHAADEIRAVLLDGFADQLRIGRKEIGRRERAGDLPDVELAPCAACARRCPSASSTISSAQRVVIR